MAKKKSERRVATLGRAKPARQRNRSGAVEVREISSTRSIDKIKPRALPPTRGLDPAHVVTLSTSIHALGLEQSITIDADDNLIAGAHRTAACRVLAAPDGHRVAELLKCMRELSPGTASPDKGPWIAELNAIPDGTGAYNPLATPVRVYAFDSHKDSTKALALEVAENEQRKDYTPKEALAFHRRLVNAGYHDDVGAPKAGKVSATKAVSTVIGKHERTIRRWLKKARDEEAMAKKMGEDGIRTYVLIEREKKDRQHLRQSAQRYMKKHSERLDKSTRDAIEIMLAHLDAK